MSKITITGINHVALWVRDLKHSVKWYKEVLELEESHGDEHHVFLKAGDQVLALFQVSEGQTVCGPHHIALSLPSGQKEQALEALRSKGVEVSEGRGHFQDLDGHQFHFA